MLSRRKIVSAGALGVVAATLPLAKIGQAFAQAAGAFDYFISPNGDDKNSGTLNSPWSITALNSKMALYGGKRIGIIGDQGIIQAGRVDGVVRSLYSMYQAQSGTGANSVLMLNGGPSATQPTYIASCDSAGNYSARLAVIDASDPASGAQPTVEAPFLAQNQYQSTVQVPQYGNITIDGLVIRNFTFAALLFYGDGQSPIRNLLIKNCEIYNQQNVKSNNNPGAIWLDCAIGAVITNCKIHDLQSNAAGTSYQMQACGVITFNSVATNITSCTFYNCCAVSAKDSWQQMNVSYCYCGWGPFGQPYSGDSQYSNIGGTIHNYLCGTGMTVEFHHNILIGPLLAYGESGQANEGTVLIYNNTFYKPGGIGGANRGIDAFSDLYPANTSGGGGTFKFYNNLIYAADGNYDGIRNSNLPGSFNKMNAEIGGGLWSALQNMDYNAYGVGMTFASAWATGLSALPLTSWRKYGYDTHSILLSSNPFTGTPAEANTSSFAINGPAAIAGQGGMPCGALDGSGLVGCNFAGGSVPNAPTLRIG